jgi:Fe-S cluster biosynthesis and repair protein YggX
MTMAGPCRRCGRTDAPGLQRPPLPGAAGREIQTEVCADCWQEWTRHEVMVINELRLNFMDPASQETLSRHMREFLHLPPTVAAEPEAQAAGETGRLAEEPEGPEGPTEPAGPADR